MGSIDYIYFQRGYYDVSSSDLKIYNSIRGLSGRTTAVKFNGRVDLSQACRFRTHLTMSVFSDTDGAMTGVGMDGYCALEKADLDLDLLGMNFSSSTGQPNYRPWTAAQSDASKITIRKVQHSNQIAFAPTSGYPSSPKHWRQAAITTNTTANHDDDIIPVDTASASGTVTVTLPTVIGGSTATFPRVGDGAELLVLDVSNNAATRNIVIAAASTDKLNGTTAGTYTISTNGGKARIVGHGSLGWWIV